MPLIATLRFIARHPLNRARPARSVLRFATWQVANRIWPGTRLVEWVNGSRLAIGLGEQGLTGNLYCGLQEYREMGFLLHVLRRGELFVDVGANRGSYTVLAGAAIGARVYAFEPGPDAFEGLVANVRINGMEDRVTCVDRAVGAASGWTTLTSGRDAVNRILSSGEPDPDAIRVEVCSLDGVLADESPVMLKIDVEGFEHAVLEGAGATLARNSVHSVILELNGGGARYGYADSRVVERMESLGFGPYSYDPTSRDLMDHDFRNSEPGNVIFVRDRELVRRRIEEAPEPQLHGRPLFAAW